MPNKSQVKKVTKYPTPKVGDKIEMCQLGGCSPQFLGKGRTCKHTAHEWVEAVVYHVSKGYGSILTTAPDSKGNWSSDYRAWRPLPAKATKKPKTMLRMPDLGPQPPPPPAAKPVKRDMREAMSNFLTAFYGAPVTPWPSARRETDIEAMAYEVQIRHPYMSAETCFITAKRFFAYADKLAGKGK